MVWFNPAINASGIQSATGTSTDNAFARWDGTAGTSLQDSGVLCDDSNNVSGIGTLACGPITMTKTSVGTATTAGITLINTTDAAAGAQQYSPVLVLQGEGWKTDETAASRTVAFAMQTVPVQGAANPTGKLAVMQSINGAAYGALWYFFSDGDLGVAARGYKLDLSADEGEYLYSSGDGVIDLVCGGASIWKAKTTSGALAVATRGNILDLSADAGEYIYSSGDNALDLVAGGAIHATVNATGVLIKDGALFIQEQAAAEAAVEAYGQFWVSTATPNLPRFSNDAGTDFYLTTAGATGTDNHVARFDGTTGIQDSVVIIADTTGDMSGIGTVACGPVTMTKTGVGTAATLGVQLINTTDAGAGAQQYSPVLSLDGEGWKTDETAGSQTVAFGLQTIPVQGAANPSGKLAIMSNINGGGYTARWYVESGGDLAAAARGYKVDLSADDGEYVYSSLDNLLDLVAGGAVHATVSTTGLTIKDGTLFLQEQASAENDVEAYGQIWIETATPNLPRFTNDAGTDFYLTTAGATGTDNHLARFDGTTGIQDSVVVVADTTGDMSGVGTLACGATTVTKTSVGTAQTLGLQVINTTDAGAGAQQYSPVLSLDGEGWKTDETAGSQTVAFGFQVIPVQGAANPTGKLAIMSNINAGGFTNRWYIFSDGDLGVAARGYKLDLSADDGEYLYSSGDNALDLVAGGAIHETVNATGVLVKDGGLFIQEQASAETNVAGYGQLWIKSDTPSSLYYADDAGTDFVIATITASTDNYLARYNGTKAVQGGGWTLEDDGDLKVNTRGYKLDLSGDEGEYIYSAGDGTLDFFATAVHATVSATGLAVKDGALFIQEQAAAETNVAGYGQLWIKSDTPSSLYYADDAGTDFIVATITASTDNYLARYDGTKAIQGIAIVCDDSANLSGVGTLACGIITETTASVGTAQTVGVKIINTTDAGAGAQQYSPVLSLDGEGWKTDPTAASQTVAFGLQTVPVQGAANPTGKLAVMSNINGGGFTNRWYFFSDGDLGAAARGYKVDFSADEGEYIWSSADNTLDLVAGGTTLQMTATTLTFGGATIPTITASTDHYLARYNGTTGIQGIAIVCDDSANLSGIGTVACGVVTETTAAVGTAQTVGLKLINTTDAGAGAQQFSPVLSLDGEGWKTTETAASQTVAFGLQTVPVQGTDNPTGKLAVMSNINGGGFTNRWYFFSDGDLGVAARGYKLDLSADDGEYLYSSGDNALDLVAGGAIHETVDATGVLVKDGALFIQEQAAHETNVAAYFQLWVETASANKLHFEDDAGTDCISVYANSGSGVINAAGLLLASGGTVHAGVDSTGLLVKDGALFIQEQAAHESNVATYFQLWVESSTPNALHLEDDAGTEIVEFLASQTTFTNGSVHLANGAMGSAPEALSDAATIATDCSKSNVFTVTLGGNRAMGEPTNPVHGYTYTWIIKQDATGSRTLSWTDAHFAFPGGTEPTMSTGANDIDVVTAIYDSGSDKFLCVYAGSLDFS